MKESKGINKKKLIITIIALVVLVAVVGTVALVQHQKNKEKALLEELVNPDDTPVEFNVDLSGTDLSEEKQALQRAQLCAEMLQKSEEEIRDELKNSSSDYSRKAIKYAMENVVVDWNSNAAEMARYYKESGMSEDEIADKLLNDDRFTKEQTEYAMEMIVE